jgi:AcrR family transcriptional regulator
MQEISTREKIITNTVPLLAQHGYAGTSMRNVAEAAQLKSSVIYYYFSDKAALLRAVRQHLNRQLDETMHALPAVTTASELLRQRLLFQIQEREVIVCLLQYFMTVKQDFPLQAGGYVPERAYQHMREIIDMGISQGEYRSQDPAFDAKILTHLINGFLLEYYPHSMTPAEELALSQRLAAFIERSLGVTS